MEQLVYKASDIMTMLGLSRNKTYKLLNDVYSSQQPFTVLRIGKDFRVPKKSFDAWIGNIY